MNFKPLVLILSLLALTSALYGQNQKFHLLIGTYTRSGHSEGIYVYEFDSQTGEVSYKTTAVVNNPSYLTISSDHKYVYSVSEDRTRNISAFAYNSTSGELTLLNKQVSGGGGPTYISVDASGKYVFAANYGGGSLSAVPIEGDGSLGADIQTISHEGGSVNKTRQTKPYVHSVVVSPDNHYLLAQDLGTDKVYIYYFDATNRPVPLSPAAQPFINVDPGSGPRHLTFHPHKNYAYLINEVNSTITAFSYKVGHMTFLQTVSTLPEGFTGIGEAADIHVSPDGKFLYGTNRTTVNDMVIYSINEKTGKLSYVGRQPTFGKESRTFAIDPTGNFILVANTGSNSIYVFKRDQKTGLLTPTGQKIDIDKPSCLKFVEID